MCECQRGGRCAARLGRPNDLSGRRAVWRGRAFRRLVADDEHVVPRDAQHRFEVIDDAPAAVHAAGGNGDCGSDGADQVVHRLHVGLVIVDRRKLFEGQWVAAGGQLAAGFLLPACSQLRVTGGEGCGQGRVEDDVEIVPVDTGHGGTLAVTVDDLFEFVKQILPTAEAEGGNEQRALVAEGVLAV